MTKTEEALCNGITFSVPRMVPTAIQEGELDNAEPRMIINKKLIDRYVNQANTKQQ